MGMIIYILRWLEVITDWLQYSTDVYCIYYEVTIYIYLGLGLNYLNRT